ncbi:MAG: HYR domain-containing protein, partial [Flavobacteriaceae bacterium]|nr:HYR domain-containing protein [Flavobacteriaceae bacterium]
GGTFPVGTTTNTFVVTDASGNTATCSFDVTVNDTEDPTISCPADITVSNDPGNCSAVVTYSVTSTDNCAGQTISQTAGIASGGTFPVGTTTNTFVVTDASGNTATCSFDVTVNDTEDPTISCPADIIVSSDPGDCDAVVTYSVSSTDNCPGETISQTAGLPSGSAFPVGTTTNTFIVTDAAGNTATCSFDVTVNDNEDPKIVCPSDIIVSNDPGDCDANVTYSVTSSDNCPGEIITQTAGLPSGAAFPIGTTTNTFVVTDASGNTFSCSFDVTVNDIENPTISCPTDITVSNDPGDCDANVTYLVTSSDNCPGEIITQTAGLPSGAAFPIGTTTNSFIVTDASGNTATCSFDVTVNDDTPPNAVCTDLTISLDPDGTLNLDPNLIDNGSNDSCGIQPVTISPSSFDCSNIGPNSVTLTVTDNNGNTSTCVATVTIQDVTPPDASCGSVTITLDSQTGEATITDINALYLGSGDTCGSVSLSLAQTVFGCSDIGTNSVTLTITDPSGNVSTCSVSVTVEAPIITSGTLTGEVVDPVPDNPVPPDDLIEVTACPGGVSEPKDVELTLNLDASSTIVPANISTWQISTDNGQTWTDVAGTAGLVQHTLVDLTTTTLVRLVIQSGNCIEFSPLAVIRFLPPDEPPVIVSVSNTDICLGDTVTVVAESYFNTPGGGQWGDGGLFNNAQPEGWRVDGIDGFFPASGNNQSEPTWKETNGPTIQGGIRYDTSDNTKFAVAWGPYDTTIETPVFHTVGMSASEAILEFHQAYYFCNGAYGVIELSLDGGNTYTVTLNTDQGHDLTNNVTDPSTTGVQVINNSNSCGNGPNGQKPTSDPFEFSSIDLSAYIDMSNLRIRFSYFGAGVAPCNNSSFPPHPANTCNNIPSNFNVRSGWVIDDVGFPYAYIDEELEWTDEDGNVVATGSTVNVTPVTPGIREYGVTSLINGCRADTTDGTEFININTSLAYAGQDFAPSGGNCGQSSITLNAYDNTLTSVDNYNNGAWETGLYVVPDLGAGDTNYLGTGMTGTWSITASNTGTCGTSEIFSSNTNPRATFTAEPGTYTLRWTLANGCFDEVDVTITSCDEIDFDGVDDFVNFKNNYDLNTNFSLEAWVKPNSVAGNRTIISKRNINTSNNGYDFSIENGTLKFNWYTAGSTGSISSTVPLTTNRWYHVAVTYDGATYLLYVDGISLGTISGTLSAPDATTGAEECLLGAVDQSNASNNIVTNHFSGWMDEVKIWDVALTENQIREMMNQEISDFGAVRGVVVPLDIAGLNWADLAGYYRMDVNCGYLLAFKGVRGRLRNINSSQEETAPIPYTSRVDNQEWATDNTWTEFDVWDPPHSNGLNGTPITWNIARISHNIRSGDKNIIVLGLISDTASKELTIADPGTAMDEANDGQSLRVTHYLKLDGDIDLIGHSQLLQDQNSVLDVTSAGKLQVDQQGTPNFYNYNYWSSPVSPVNITANNTDYSVGTVLKDGTTSSNPQTINWTASYSPAAITSPITISKRWIFAYENYPNYVDVAQSYADWRYLQDTGTIATGLGFTMKGSGVGALGSPPAMGDPATDYRNYVFEGKPNNGTITSPVSGGYQALLGNPYASSIDAEEFIRDNIPGGNPGTSNSIDGTVYFWEHYTSNASHYLELYEGGYATYNLTGGNAAISPPLISGLGSPTKFPGRYIPVGQGFFVTATGSGGNVTFHNDQRVYVKEAVGTSVFMEANNNSMDISGYTSESDDDADADLIKRIRINGKTPEGAIRPLLLGFIPNGEATDGVDLAYDAENTDDFPNDFSWVIGDKLYTTQGVGDFDITKQYPIGVVLTNPGDIEISLLEIENFNPDIKVFLYDALFGTTTCLNYDDFQIELHANTYMDRFYLVFQVDEETLGNSEINNDNIFVKYLNDSDELLINMPNINDIEDVALYNMLGQEVIVFDPEDFDFANITELRIPIESISEATYVVRVKTKNGVANKMVLITY